ncbi:response regulator transcription factor [Methylobacterium sp. DB0501]|nr:response regulator transcription factor [Methylobacterium sp. DB0501]
MLEALECLLLQENGISIVGRGTSLLDAGNLAEATVSDILVHDVSLSETTAVDVLHLLKQEGLSVPVVVVSTVSNRHIVHQTLAAGARGYVLKRASSRHLVHAIRSVHAGGVYLDAEIGGTPVEALQLAGLGKVASGAITVRPLAPREEEVLRLIALGFTAKEIGDRLGINARSVETHKRRAIDKLGVRTRAKIVEYGMMKGWFRNAPH